MSDITSDPIHTAVREHYGTIARTQQSKDRHLGLLVNK